MIFKFYDECKKKTDGFGLDVHLLIVEGESLTSWPHVWIEIWVAGYFFKGSL